MLRLPERKVNRAGSPLTGDAVDLERKMLRRRPDLGLVEAVDDVLSTA